MHATIIQTGSARQGLSELDYLIVFMPSRAKPLLAFPEAL